MIYYIKKKKITYELQTQRNLCVCVPKWLIIKNMEKADIFA